MSCIVRLCPNRSDRGFRKGLKFYRLPPDPHQAELWLRAAGRLDMLQAGHNKHRKICNKHFESGKFSLIPTNRDYVPSIFPVDKRPVEEQQREQLKQQLKLQKQQRKLQQLKQKQQQREQQLKQHVARTPGPLPPGAQLLPLAGPILAPSGPVIHQLGFLPGPVLVPPGPVTNQLGSLPGPDLAPLGPVTHNFGSLQGPVLVPPGPVTQHLGAPPTFYLLIQNPPGGSTEKAAQNKEGKIHAKVGQDKIITNPEEDHNYCKPPEPASIKPEPSETETPERDSTEEPKQDLKPRKPRPQQTISQNQEPPQSDQRTSNTNPSQAAAADSQNEPQDDQDPRTRLKPLLCPICNSYYFSLKHFATHVRKHAAEYILERSQRFACEVCDRKFSHKKGLQDHLVLHSGEKPFSCTFCGRSYALKKSMMDHQKMHVTGFKCGDCGALYRYQEALERHRQRCTILAEREKKLGLPPRLKPHQCDKCRKCFLNQVNLRDHQHVHTGERPHQCTRCPKRFATRPEFRRHMRFHAQEQSHICSFCDRKFNFRKVLRCHIVSKHTEKTVLCSACGKTFCKVSEMNAHYARVHQKDKQRKTPKQNKRTKPFSCSVCLQEFDFLKTAKDHLEIHKQERADKESTGQSVEVCDISVKFSGAQHLCSECGKLYLSEQRLKAHMRAIHFNKRRFRCSTCDLTFKYKRSIVSHMRLHNGESVYSFSCSICQKSYKEQMSLDCHMRKHSGERPFACAVCSAHFRSKQVLQAHAAMHNKGLPFACPKCSYRFKSFHYLNLHLREKHEAGDHRCSYCHKTFLFESGLHSHIARKHITPKMSDLETLQTGTETKKQDLETLQNETETESAVNSIRKPSHSPVGEGHQATGPGSETLQ